MTKNYQPIVIEKANDLIEGLISANFFEEYEINDLTFVKSHLCDLLTEKFIDGVLDEDFDDIFTEEEFEQLLKELIAGSILNELKDKGYVNSYSDENTEEMFFLTEEGKKLAQKIKQNNKKD